MGHGRTGDRPSSGWWSESGQVVMKVLHNAAKKEIHPIMEQYIKKGSTIYSDEWVAYRGLQEKGWKHKMTRHGAKEYARDEDKDAKCEIDSNTIEGIWVGLRNFLRPFRGVSRHYLGGYVTVFMLSYNLVNISSGFLRFALFKD